MSHRCARRGCVLFFALPWQTGRLAVAGGPRTRRTMRTTTTPDNASQPPSATLYQSLHLGPARDADGRRRREPHLEIDFGIGSAEATTASGTNLAICSAEATTASGDNKLPTAVLSQQVRLEPTTTSGTALQPAKLNTWFGDATPIGSAEATATSRKTLPSAVLKQQLHLETTNSHLQR